MRKPADRIFSLLQSFAIENGVNSKGTLSLALVLTRSASRLDPPFDYESFLTPKGGQVKGLSGAAAQKILIEYGVVRQLSEEGGRTSRGNIERMKAYVDLLNRFHNNQDLDFKILESWWIERIREFFSSEPLHVKLDSSKSCRHIISQLLEAAFTRQRESHGTMVAGAVMQHLVGAKLQVALPSLTIEHQGFSVADAPSKRKGDFFVNNTAIHVTTAPTESLARKCLKNLEESVRPVIITTKEGSGGAMAHARAAEIADRVDVLEIEQFIATNVYEWSFVADGSCTNSITELIEAYNRIIDECETDPSLKISIG